MKFISNFLKLLPLLALFIGFQSCSDDDDATGPVANTTTVVDIATSSDDFSILVSALIRADLVTTLEGSGPFTVFAPTNTAFQALLDSNSSWTTVDDIPVDVLTNVLLNHVIIGADVDSATLISAGSGYTNTGATGADDDNLSLFYNLNGTTLELNGGSSTAVGANVTTPDLTATNGRVHVINQVLLPPTIVDHAVANPNLSILVQAIGYADTQTTTDLTATLSGDGPFTAFAPSNTAFADLLTELSITALTDLDAATVEAVLGFHVVAGANVTSNELMTGAVTTLGGDVQLDASALTITDPNDRVSNIIPSLVDIQCVNGVVHAIDKVILPQQ
ncbi:fasciclin domain-containing protein [Winogradskyella sp. A3E31]|uniref:fasciclin domain-containing protein n=1 Tax=Winogradskyella sp. A3E31 TaxID=3349637 RepID=UPI00398A971F